MPDKRNPIVTMAMAITDQAGGTGRHVHVAG
jgi:hypothetical protein